MPGDFDSLAVGELIDNYYRVREKRKEYNQAVDECKAMMNQLEAEIIRRLEDSKQTGGRGHEAAASVQKSIHGTFKNPEKFYQWGYRHKKLHTLLERRISSPAFRELYDELGEIPGLDPFERTKIHVSKLSK